MHQKKMFPWLMELLSDYINKLQIFLAVTECLVSFCCCFSYISACRIQGLVFAVFPVNGLDSHVSSFFKVTVLFGFSWRCFTTTGFSRSKWLLEISFPSGTSMAVPIWNWHKQMRGICSGFSQWIQLQQCINDQKLTIHNVDRSFWGQMSSI